MEGVGAVDARAGRGGPGPGLDTPRDGRETGLRRVIVSMRTLKLCQVLSTAAILVGCEPEEDFWGTASLEGAPREGDHGFCYEGAYREAPGTPWLSCTTQWNESPDWRWMFELTITPPPTSTIEAGNSFPVDISVPFDCAIQMAGAEDAARRTWVMLRYEQLVEGDEEEPHWVPRELYGSCAGTFPATIELETLDRDRGVVEGRVGAASLVKTQDFGACACAPDETREASLDFRLPLGRQVDL